MRTEDKEFDRSDTGFALLNNNIEAFNLYKQKRKQQSDTNRLQSQINNLKNDLSEIKSLLNVLVQREINGTDNK